MPEKLISTAEAAVKLGVTQRRVQVLCEQGRIKGARRIGRTWIVPATIRIEPADFGPALGSTKHHGR
jgi:excisionase family DNA binding protein